MSQAPPAPPAETMWHYTVGQQQLGPVPTPTLLSMTNTGAITSSTMVWRDGMAAWAPAGSMPELAFAFRGGQPVCYASPAAKSKVAAGVLGILVGGFGIHRFYLGYTGIGILQIVVTLVTCGLGSVWGFIEGILILTGSMNRDADGQPLRD